MAKLKEVAASAQIVSQVALEKAFRELKSYIDTKDGANNTAIQNVQNALDALVGSGDADKVINTFNEIKAFLADYTEDDTLKSLIDAVNIAIGEEKTRAMNAEAALAGRIKTLEDVEVMSAQQAKDLFDSIFNPA